MDRRPRNSSFSSPRRMSRGLSMSSLAYDEVTPAPRRSRRQTALADRGARSPYGRPDRVAFWAVAMAVVAMIAAAASAHATTGGVSDDGTGDGSCADSRLGNRTLALGDCGNDVKTLNWILKSKNFGKEVSLRRNYISPTEGTVEVFQKRKGLDQTGVFNRKTHRKLARSMRRDVASYYGPGLYGNRMACGKRLKPGTVGVAHRKLPCGTKVVFKKGGKFLRTKVVDRGPYVRGVTWDLTEAAAQQLGISHNTNLRSAIVRR